MSNDFTIKFTPDQYVNSFCPDKTNSEAIAKLGQDIQIKCDNYLNQNLNVNAPHKRTFKVIGNLRDIERVAQKNLKVVPKGSLAEAEWQKVIAVCKNEIAVMNKCLKKEMKLDKTAVKHFKGEGKLQFKHEKPVVSIPNDLVLTTKQKKILQEECLKDYQKSVECLDESISDAALQSPAVKEMVDKASLRLFKVVEAYAEVLVDMQPPPKSTKEIMVLRILADMYLMSPVKTQFYSGNIGSNPLAVKKVFTEGNLREKMFLLINAKKGFMSRIMSDPEIFKRVNEKLPEEAKLSDAHFGKRFSTDGNYAGLTDSVPLRSKMKTPEEIEEWKSVHNPTIKDADSKLRIPLSIRERRHSTGEPIVKKEHENTKLRWSAGKAEIIPTTSKDMPDNPYIQAAEDMRFQLVAGVSGTSDQVMSIIQTLGMDSREDMFIARLACLGWVIDSKSHSAHEVMMAGRSFGLEYEMKPDFYKELDPLNTGFYEDLETAQRNRGFPLPHECLSADYVRQKADSLFKSEGG